MTGRPRATANGCQGGQSAPVLLGERDATGRSHRRLFEDHGRIPPAEFEANHYRQNISADHAETRT